MPKLPEGRAPHFSKIFGINNLSFLWGFDIPNNRYNIYLIQKQPSCKKKCAGPVLKRDVKSKVAAKKWL